MVVTDKVIRTAIADIAVEEGVMVCRVYVEEVTLPLLERHAEELNAHYGQYFPMPCVIQNHPSGKAMSKEVRDFLGSEKMTRAASCLAVVVASSFRKVMTNLFLKLVRPTMEVQLFTGIEQAKEWARKRI